MVEVLSILAQEVSKGVGDLDLKPIGVGLAIGIGAIGPGIGLGIMVSRAMEALGRNPEAENSIRQNLVLGMAFAEAIGIYAFLLGVVIAFVI